MAQRYRNLGNVRNPSSGLPPGVKRMGYMRKVTTSPYNKINRRFFVLHMESNYGVARFEYYGNEKKWRSGYLRKRIEIKSCVNISSRPHQRYHNVINLYTEDDCFSVIAETEELDLWLKDLLEVHKNCLEVDENARWRPFYDFMWEVVIDRHDIDDDRLRLGNYRVALSSKSLFLLKMKSTNENDNFEFPLMSIRRCGHTRDHFFIELGRSSVIGAGEIYMATEGTIVAQDMHETVLSAMKSSKIREDSNPLPRPRSASTSENSNAVATRRPIAPQAVSSSMSTCGLSTSRERCDSLPNRTQSLSGNPHNCVLGALSSPYASGGPTFRNLGSRPHSMYEWPSCNSPSARNASFSPNALSSAAACSNSTEDIDKLKLTLSYSYSESTDKPCGAGGIDEKSDEYLKMCLMDEARSDDLARERTNEFLSKIPDYMDMKSSTSVPKSESILGNCLPAPHHSVSDNIAVLDGYLDMSPKNSLPEDAWNTNSFRKDSDGHKYVTNHEMRVELEKVLSLLKIEEGVQSTLNYTTNNRPTAIVNGRNDPSGSPTSLISNPDYPILSNNAIMGAKPPLPEKTYQKTESRSSVGPPLPVRRDFPQATPRNESSEICRTLKSTTVELHNKEDLSPNLSTKNSEFDDQDVFYNTSNKIKEKSIVSPGQNTNFSCLNACERSDSHSLLPCAPICSAPKAPNSFNKSALFLGTQSDINKLQFSPNDSTNKFSSTQDTCDNLEMQLPTNSSVPPPFQSKSSVDSAPSGDQNSDILSVTDKLNDVSGGDYVNIDFHTSSPPSHQIKSGLLISKNSPLSLPPCTDSDHHDYSNIQFGKPFCPTPKPMPALLSNTTKNEWPILYPNISKLESQKASSDSPKCAVVAPIPRNIPNTLPAFRKQMSAPAGPLALRPELPSPGRKSSCPVTASASMIRSPLPGTSVCPTLHGTPSIHLKVSTSRSPDHSSVSSVSSASDEVSSTHSSPKTLTSTQNFRQGNVDGQYENVVIPQKSSTGSRPPSTSSEEKELNYAMLDLGPPMAEDAPRSPTIQKTMTSDNEETSTYAEIDFTKSEGLKNTSGSLRDGRL